MWAAGPAAMPFGPVHLFTDIEGSTRLWEQQPALMRSALAQHDALARATVQAQAGRVVKTTGDGLHAVFDEAAHALAAALSLLQQLADPAHTAGLPLALRCGLHLGADEARDDDFFGPDVNRAARVMAAAHGGQLLVSEAVALALAGQLPPGVGLRALGPVHLRDLAQPERLYQVLAPPLRTDFPPPRGLASVPHNLPQPLNRFIGRGDALAQVAALCGQHRLVTLWGPGGMGKSRLSLQLGRELLDRFTDGVWLVELAPVQAADRVPQAVADALGVQEAPGQPLAEALARHLRERQLLLILDNCEHLRSAAAALAKQLLQGAAGLHILASSRELLHVAGECAWPVPALGLPPAEAPPPADTGALMQHEAVRLFVDRARLVQPSFALGPDNAAAVLDICHRLDGIPLALELAAARVRAMSVHTMAPRLADSFRLVSTQDETVAPRQRTLQHLIDWSWQLLGADEQCLLARLSVFAGGFTLEAAEAVCADLTLPPDDVLDLLGQLVDKSLVLPPGGAPADAPPRWRMLETVRLHMAARLPTGDVPGLHQRLLAWAVHLASTAAQQLDSPGQAAALLALDAERANLQRAHALALEETHWADPTDALAQARALDFALRDYWINRGLLSTGLQQVQASLDHRLASTPDAGRARGLFDAGQLCNRLGRHAAACEALEESLAIVRALGAQVREVSILQPLGLAYDGLGQAERAHACHVRAIEVARALNLPLQLASAQVCLAQWHQVRQQWDEAEQLYREAHGHARSQAAETATATIALNLGMVALQRGDLIEARAQAMDALPVAQASSSAVIVLGLLDLCCGLALASDQGLKARHFHDAAQVLCHRTGLVREVADAAILAPWLSRLDALQLSSARGPEATVRDAPGTLSRARDGPGAAEDLALLLVDLSGWLQGTL